eukprot:TRINITY_DN11592_c0_g1_i1.p1 TRINITY_DN11592_c0_g1~~TRINITY_DN11592_c0_g1_i1.p1  ORF type:complete len:488 (+),score=114.02 TRINITY_DN11592_c0_g1_i1:91-1554(+)
MALLLPAAIRPNAAFAIRTAATGKARGAAWRASAQLVPQPVFPGRATHELASSSSSYASRESRRHFSERKHDVTQARLKEFLDAELQFFAQGTITNPIKALKIRQIVLTSDPRCLAQLCYDELPLRYATRVRKIEALANWEDIPELVELRDMHILSFRELRLASLDDLEDLTKVIYKIRARQKALVPLVAETMLRAQDLSNKETKGAAADGAYDRDGGRHSEEWLADKPWTRNLMEMDQWAQEILYARCGTEILMAHYEAFTSLGETSSTQIGVFDTACDPWDVCLQAAEPFSDRVLIEIAKPLERIKICHSPRYLFYIMEELLKNAARATLDVCKDESEVSKRPIKISVSANPRHVVIRVSDRAGGIPWQESQQMWTTSISSVAETSSLDDALAERPSLPYCGLKDSTSPLSGRGVGMPMARLYAKYLGGSLRILSLPGVGVDAWLYLHRIDPAEAEPPGTATDDDESDAGTTTQADREEEPDQSS